MLHNRPNVSFKRLFPKPMGEIRVDYNAHVLKAQYFFLLPKEKIPIGFGRFLDISESVKRKWIYSNVSARPIKEQDRHIFRSEDAIFYADTYAIE